jgi:pyridoxal phosphate enzyme (YggS family)
MSLQDIRARIEKSCKDANRAPDGVTLVAVTKNRTAEDIRQLLAAGQRVFGENRVQDAIDKWTPLRAEYPDAVLHFIGQLQTNKARDAVRFFDVIETVDRPALAEALEAEMKRQGRSLPCFVQVNTGEEPQKGGIAPHELAPFLAFCRRHTSFPLQGLMCIPPADELPDMHFALLHKYARAEGLSHLSMGMSADFETAIRYGATHVRIGQALFDGA